MISSATNACSPVTVIVPCYDEAESLPRLIDALELLRAEAADRYDIRYLLVDDGSRDQTWSLLQQYAVERDYVDCLRHPRNLGIAAAIRTGLRHVTTELSASIDADCTYAPHQLLQLLPALTEAVDLVVASPYHPAGEVVGVQPWRLQLSQAASRLYARVLRHQLFTYTSCFRVYRTKAIASLSVERNDFVGIAELLWRVEQAGGRIVEVPAVLTVRTTGRSKLRLLRTIAAHLGLLWQIFRGPRPLPPRSDAIPQTTNTTRESFHTPASVTT